MSLQERSVGLFAIEYVGVFDGMAAVDDVAVSIISVCIAESVVFVFIIVGFFMAYIISKLGTSVLNTLSNELMS